jgi:hypothetical protein
MKLNDRSWLGNVRHVIETVGAPGSLQSVAIGFYTWRWRHDLWRWPYHIEHCKGTLVVIVGPLFIEFGG